jgi:lysozyme family protein
VTDHFASAVEVVFDHEGGLADNPNDPGGITNFGISLRWAQRQMAEAGDFVLDLFDTDGDNDIDADDIRNMPRASAKAAYLKFFWKPNGYGRIENNAIACKVFDMAVNMGSRQANRLVQRACRAAEGVEIADDGILGRISIAQINHAEPNALLAATRSEQAGFYRALILRNNALRKHGIDVHNFEVFKKGWLRRAYA